MWPLGEDCVETNTQEFASLVDELEDIEVRRTGTGGFASPEDGARRQHIERRLVELLTTDFPSEERRDCVRLPCDLPVLVHLGTEPAKGVITDIGTGGVFVETALRADVGAYVGCEVERRPGALEHGLRVRGKIAWLADPSKTGRPGFGVAFTANDEASERRVRRFIIELLRKRMHHVHS
ncbi:MAG: PilZ domain-containing protein [Deltaproteobacteria bacterium]|nr:PilZ domain-containing protein [Deltaproteobacteria bacterium]